ncbi:MAG: hypothetical protein PHU85_00065 [Phycisphaerae bacterium]|nr:hypothetical protein [Phycisphaerae bacterium]
MASPGNGGRQQQLPFGLAEASGDELKNVLGLALMRVASGDCRLAQLCMYVFRVTKGGAAGLVCKKSYKELAAAPYGLCCSREGARKVVARAARFGLIGVREDPYVSGGQAANSYWIDWDGVRRLLDLSRRPGGDRAPHGPGVPEGHGGVPEGHGGVPEGHPYKENLLFESLFETRTGPEADPPSMDSDGRPRASKRGVCGGIVVTGPAAPEFWQQARSRRINPLPCTTEFSCGVFRKLALRNLEQVGTLIKWFRCQLSALDPAIGDTEADLLFILAAAAYATGLPAESVRRNRVAIFNSTVTRRAFRKVRPYLPDARAALDRAIERYGREALLCGSVWPPRPLVPNDAEVHAEVHEA